VCGCMLLFAPDSAAGLPTSSEGVYECGLLVGKGKVRPAAA